MNEICPRCAEPLGLTDVGWPESGYPVWITASGIACSEECARALTGNKAGGRFQDGRYIP